MPVERHRGRIKFFNQRGAYGFITGEDLREFYFRESDLVPGITSLSSGEEVEFSLVSAMRGPRAISIKKVNGGV